MIFRDFFKKITVDTSKDGLTLKKQLFNKKGQKVLELAPEDEIYGHSNYS